MVYEYYTKKGKFVVDDEDYNNTPWNELHRENGPALVRFYNNGNIYDEHYYLNGVRHREDGPAYIYYSGNDKIYLVYYYLKGIKYTKDEFDRRVNMAKYECHTENEILDIYEYDKIPWERLHRKNEPALITYLKNGKIKYEEYYLNGKLHRDSEPAFINYYENGIVKYSGYFYNGKRQRNEGPTGTYYYDNGNIECEEYWVFNESNEKSGVVYLNYSKNEMVESLDFFIDDEECSPEEFDKEFGKPKFLKRYVYYTKEGRFETQVYEQIPINILHNIDEPALIFYNKNGTIRYLSYYLNGKLHNERGPAWITYFKNGEIECKFYYNNGEYHRELAPAIIGYYENGKISGEDYYLEGKRHRQDGPAQIESLFKYF